MKAITGAVTLALAAAALAGAHAVAGDPAAGRLKADTCLGCHGIPGYTNVYPTFHVPKLGGQHAAYLEAALKAYQTGQRGHGTMHANVASMSEQDIKDIAAFFANAPR